MHNVISIESARAQQNRRHIREYYSVGALQSPVPNLIGLLEPILDGIKNNAQQDFNEDLREFIDILNLSRAEIDQLEDMANFLLTVHNVQADEQS